MSKTAGYYFREIKETKKKIIRNSTLISVSDL